MSKAAMQEHSRFICYGDEEDAERHEGIVEE